MRIEELRGRRVAVWGTGREGRAALVALRTRLPEQRLDWIAPPSEGDLARSLADELVSVHALEPDAAFLARFEFVLKSPGISPYRSPFPEAEARGVRFLSGSALWFAEHPDARVIAVTGTKGKSTTSALIAHLLRASGKRVALCGNIGVPLLDLLEPRQAPDWWVMELSSFQTRDLGAVPEIAVVLNLFPEHLDWHGSEQRYYADKLALLGRPGGRPRVSLLGALTDFPSGSVPERGVRWYGGGAASGDGFRLAHSAIWQGKRRLYALSDLPLPGEHNALNVCAALAAVDAAGVDASRLRDALGSFRPLPHRLQTLGERDGLTWVNDSIATTPHATLAALAHFADRAVTVLVGGHDRGLDWRAFGDALRLRPPHALIAMGEQGVRILAALGSLPEGKPRREHASGLEQAVERARAITPEGGVVLLSPGAPSFGAFRDYIERGRRFAALAGFDPDAIARIEGLGI